MLNELTNEITHLMDEHVIIVSKFIKENSNGNKGNEQKQRYLKHVAELYAKGCRFIVKVTDPNNKAYLFADNPSGLYETKDCVDWYDEYDGINHFTSDQAKEEAARFQETHPNWTVQIKEISFDKK